MVQCSNTLSVLNTSAKGEDIVFFEGWVDGVDGVSELGWELGWRSDDGTWIDR